MSRCCRGFERPEGTLYANDTNLHNYAFTLCGTSNFTCLPTWVSPYVTGTAVQYWGDPPPCNTSAPECTDGEGNAVCCTQNCHVLGVGLPQWQVSSDGNGSQALRGRLDDVSAGALCVCLLWRLCGPSVRYSVCACMCENWPVTRDGRVHSRRQLMDATNPETGGLVVTHAGILPSYVQLQPRGSSQSHCCAPWVASSRTRGALWMRLALVPVSVSSRNGDFLVPFEQRQRPVLVSVEPQAANHVAPDDHVPTALQPQYAHRRGYVHENAC